MTSSKPSPKLPGRREIAVWFADYMSRAGTLANLDRMTPESLYQLMAMHIGWYWDLEDVGLLPHPVTGAPSPYAALYAFLGSLIESRKASR